MNPEQMRALADDVEQPGACYVRGTAVALRDAADTIELLVQQRDALAEVAGIEPEWTEKDV